MLRNLGIRWQILSALALPVLVLGLISSQVTYQALVDMRQASQARELAQAADGFADLVGGLQTERALSVSVVLDQAGAAKQLKVVRAAVDQGLAAVRTRIYSGSNSDAVKQVLARSASGHNGLTALRAAVDAGTVDSRAVVSRYSDVIVADVEVPSDLASTLRSQDSAVNFQQFAQISRAGEALAQEQLIGATAIMNGKADTVDQRELGAQEAAGELALNAFRRSGTAAQLAALKAALAAPTARSANLSTARAAFRFAGTVNRPAVTLTDWTAITTGQLTALRGTLEGLNQSGIQLASDDYTAAKQKLQLTLAGAISITLLTLLLALGLSRRISAPLRRLTLAATQIRDELPKIVESVQADANYELNLPVVQIIGRNEVSRLAAAFVDVNAVTVAIAHEQARLRAAVADMFVNVARRNQVLLSRQLSLIDQLERNEVNPDALEELFRLDHLATRMRRNAESLLVLAGIESGRRLRDPMPLSDVVRTATSEIEHYSRVSLSLEVDPPVFAHLALPIAHLLAELLENATNFSDPGSAVVVMASATGQGVRMTVADDGLGIPAADLLEINARIDQPPTAEALSSQRLGFFVVGRLAQRLDAKVTLTSGRSGGTAVLIDLPASLFVPGSVAGAPSDRQQVTASIPDQGGAPAWTPEPVGALAAAAPFVAAFPPAAGTTPELPAPMQRPALPLAFNAAAFEAESALEPVWTPQPDNLAGQAGSVVEQSTAPGLPARRGAAPAAEPLAVPQLLPRPTIPVTEPVEPPKPDVTSAQSGTDRPGQAAPAWADSEWAVSEWVAPTESAPTPPIEAAGPAETDAERPGSSIFSGFRGRQAAKPGAAVEPVVAHQPEASGVAEPAAAPMAFLDSADAVDPWFDAGSTSTAEADQGQTWDQIITPALIEPTDPTPAASPSWAPELTTADPEAWTPQAPGPEQWAPEVWSPEPAVPAGTPEPVASEPVAELWAPTPAAEAWTPEPQTWAPEPTTQPETAEPVAQAWAPEPVAETQTPEPAEAWTPQPAEASTPKLAEAWTPEPAEAWTPEPVAEAWTPQLAEPWSPAPVAEVETPSWTPEPAAETWTPEPQSWVAEPVADQETAETWTPSPAPATAVPVAYQPVPEPWTPDTGSTSWTPESWAPEPEAWTPVPQPEATPAVPQPEPKAESAAAESLSQTLTAAIDILPQRTSIRTALRRGRRRGDPQPMAGRPFNGGFDPIAPAREFALREGFGSMQEPEQATGDRSGAAAEVPMTSGPTAGSVSAPSQPWSSTNVPVERRQYPRTGEQAAEHGRSALASEALTELSRLSSYSPTSMPSPDRPGLQRRTPSEVPIEEPEPVVESSGQRARTAASVRSMLAGFKAGVERGRTSPAANRPAPTLPPPPRNSAPEEPR
ncbi:MAG TPA: nitrate- and nitrite sensing domain-containing protein [Kineosporiaceae bacterium]|nr:nitrate- and nitrite sensing domain-containing protein [Kineosporiaceae bacterium]